MFRYALLAATVSLSLSACAPMGVESKEALHDAFEAPVAYQDAYQRARDQAEMCLRGESQHPVEGSLDQGQQSAQVYVHAPFTKNRLASVDIQAIDTTHSQVKVAMWGVNVWDEHAVTAMRDAIMLGVPTCRSYMPVNERSR